MDAVTKFLSLAPWELRTILGLKFTKVLQFSLYLTEHEVLLHTEVRLAAL